MHTPSSMHLSGVRRLLLVPATFVVATALAVGAVAAPGTNVHGPKPGDGVLTVPITGTFTDTLGGTGTFDGTFTVQKFTSSGDTLNAVGTLSGTLTNSVGTVLGSVLQTITLPVDITTATCEILDLSLGPLHLDLLGLVVDLNQVHLTITAESGPGNLLGNLLCAVAGLLDGGISLNVVRDLLNVIIGVINDLGL